MSAEARTTEIETSAKTRTTEAEMNAEVRMTEMEISAEVRMAEAEMSAEARTAETGMSAEIRMTETGTTEEGQTEIITVAAKGFLSGLKRHRVVLTESSRSRKTPERERRKCRKRGLIRSQVRKK